MKQSWTSDPRASMRRLAVEMLLHGEAIEEVAEVCGVSARTLQRWVRACNKGGEAALADRPRPGRPAKLDDDQARKILAWLDRDPVEFGFPTQRWTARRVARLIEQRLGIHMNFRYLSDWLRRHGVTPQMPQRQARQRDEALIDGWMEHQWPRIKKRSVI